MSTVPTATTATIRREVRLVRRTGDAPTRRHRWACSIDPRPDGLDVRIAAPEGLEDADLERPAAQLHDALLRQLPRMLHRDARSEVGIVRTETEAGVSSKTYALTTCAEVVVTLDEHLWPEPAAPWRGTCSPADLDRDLPVVLGPSAVLSLASGALEMPDDPFGTEKSAVPSWLSVDTGHRSPYPPHDCPPEITGSGPLPATIAWWAAHTEHWMRPMRTTRASRGQYRVRAALPSVADRPPRLWVESLVSLDTLGRYWHASLSVERDGGRWWLTRPLSVQIRAGDLLRSAVGQIEPPRPAMDHDPIDGESFGWAPGLLTARTAGELGVRSRPR